MNQLMTYVFEPGRQMLIWEHSPWESRVHALVRILKEIPLLELASWLDGSPYVLEEMTASRERDWGWEIPAHILPHLLGGGYAERIAFDEMMFGDYELKIVRWEDHDEIEPK